MHGHDPGGLILHFWLRPHGAGSGTGREPSLGPAIFGVVFGIGLFVPGEILKAVQPRLVVVVVQATFIPRERSLENSAGPRLIATP